ncbi:MAG TPA: hypothetical protein VIK22_09400 [Candidatus Anoxymicrobiaceae bacterium]|jgi:hypothetical protein
MVVYRWARSIRQAHVQEDELGPLDGRLLHALAPCRRFEHVETVSAQGDPEQLPDLCFVVDHEYPRTHVR